MKKNWTRLNSTNKQTYNSSDLIDCIYSIWSLQFHIFYSTVVINFLAINIYLQIMEISPPRERLKRKEFISFLQEIIHAFENPQVKLEQYMTPYDVTADFFTMLDVYFFISERVAKGRIKRQNSGWFLLWYRGIFCSSLYDGCKESICFWYWRWSY